MVVVVLVYQLEVLDAGLVDTAIEVEHECLHLCFSKNMSEKGQIFLLTFVPLGRLVKEEHDSFCVINLELLLYRLVFLYKIEKVEYKNKGLIPKYYLQSVVVDQKAQPIG